MTNGAETLAGMAYVQTWYNISCYRNVWNKKEIESLINALKGNNDEGLTVEEMVLEHE